MRAHLLRQRFIQQNMHDLVNQYYSFPSDYPTDEQPPVLDTWSAWGIQEGSSILVYPFFCNLRQVQSP